MYSDAFDFNSTLLISKLNESKNHKALFVASFIAVIFRLLCLSCTSSTPLPLLFF